MDSGQRFDLATALLGAFISIAGVAATVWFTYWSWRSQHRIDQENIEKQQQFDLALGAAERVQSRLTEAAGFIFDFKRSNDPSLLDRALLAADAARAEKSNLTIYPNLPAHLDAAWKLMRNLVGKDRKARSLAAEDDNDLAMPVVLLFTDSAIEKLSDISRKVIAARAHRRGVLFSHANRGQGTAQAALRNPSGLSKDEREWVLFVEEQFKNGPVSQAEGPPR
ncbi:hypothetical protein [Paractinoplanes rishiriensis]|uniref:Uncharacterized protein n=1 Tax=Paractinoplanes rishiriensis TaxID=1050105 RepID=A0A919JX53_9ACTN|nr:hypothetical protein [Actinoplanes rishiriensis]GIE95249.1 hypothetical protein Ari01nite_27140 [Actinoplanes rishiriensis]